jgi:tRNA pseudouridine synthase 9
VQPVSAHPIQIIHHDPAGEFIVIDKPGSVPVHPTGRYTKNTCTEMLMSEEFGFDKVYSPYLLLPLRLNTLYPQLERRS